MARNCAIDCYSIRDRSWGPRPLGRPKRPRRTGRRRQTATGRISEQGERGSGFGGVGYSFCAAGPGEAWLIYAMPGPECRAGVVWLPSPWRRVRAHPGRAASGHLRRRARVGRSPSRSRPSTSSDGALGAWRRSQPALARARRATRSSTGNGTAGWKGGARTRAIQPGPVGEEPTRGEQLRRISGLAWTQVRRSVGAGRESVQWRWTWVGTQSSCSSGADRPWSRARTVTTA